MLWIYLDNKNNHLFLDTVLGTLNWNRTISSWISFALDFISWRMHRVMNLVTLKTLTHKTSIPMNATAP